MGIFKHCHWQYYRMATLGKLKAYESQTQPRRCSLYPHPRSLAQVFQTTRTEIFSFYKDIS